MTVVAQSNVAEYLPGNFSRSFTYAIFVLQILKRWRKVQIKRKAMLVPDIYINYTSTNGFLLWLKISRNENRFIISSAKVSRVKRFTWFLLANHRRFYD